MNLRDLQYLVAVADHRHFGRAAEACSVSQPTLSTQLRKLEEELGVTLVERRARLVLLTPAGEQVVERARRILREANDIYDVARQVRDPASGRLTIGLFPTLGPYLLPHVVPQIHARFPHLELLLVEEKTDEVLRRLRIGELDAAIVALPVDDDQLHQEVLFDEDFVLAVPADHPLAAVSHVPSPSVLAGESVLLLEDGHCLRQQALEVCELAGAAEMQGFRATSLETLRQMVAAGVGVTLLPQLAVQPPVPAYEEVHLVRFDDQVPRRRIAMLWRRSSARAGFLREVAELFRALPEGLASSRKPTAEAALA